MHYRALACDSDGTLLRRGKLAQRTRRALERLRTCGRKVILVTGETDKDFAELAQSDLFDCIIGENGAVLCQAGPGGERTLAAGLPAHFIRALRRRVSPLTVGKVMVATERPALVALCAALDEFALDWQIVFNRKNVMALPPGISKATGLAAALAALGLQPKQTVGIGDGENDADLIGACGYGVAVADAVPVLKEQADWITTQNGPAGLVELITRLLAGDLPAAKRRRSA